MLATSATPTPETGDSGPEAKRPQSMRLGTQGFKVYKVRRYLCISIWSYIWFQFRFQGFGLKVSGFRAGFRV